MDDKQIVPAMTEDKPDLEAPVTVELKPCPFCGGEASFEHLESGAWSIGCIDIDGECMGFQSLQTFARQADAIAAWNTRTSPPREPGEDERKAADLAAYNEMRRQGFSGGWDNEALVSVIIAALTLPEQPRQETLFDAIAHGDEVHRAWLKEAIDNHFAGRPVPQPREQPRPVDDVERMREALEKIVEATKYVPNSYASEANRIARAALQIEGGEAK